MELDLNKLDFAQVGITTPQCLALLPNEGEKHRQRVVVASQDGHLICFSIKKNEVQVHFKTLVGPSITSVRLGGPLGAVADKVFVASDNRVSGFNRKGKQFLAFDTNMTEQIKSMAVLGADLLVCGHHVFNHFKDCKESGTYLCGDTIVDVAAVKLAESGRIIVVLACSGRVLRLIEYCRVRQTIELESIPTVLHVAEKDFSGRVFCGFADGQVVQFNIHPMYDIKQSVVVEDRENRSGITCLDTHDVTGDGRLDLLLGKRDGSVHIYTLNGNSDMDFGNALIFKKSYGESISSIKGGSVRSGGYIEVIVVTFTGLVFSLSTHQSPPIAKQDTVNLEQVSNTPILDEDYEELSRKFALERQRLAANIFSNNIESSTGLHVNDSLSLNKEEANYDLYIEIPTPLDVVHFQCDCPIEFLTTDSLTMGDINPLEGVYFKATFRAKGFTTRAEFKFRAVEGQNGSLQAFISPKNSPGVMEVRQYPIRPLSLHMRIHKEQNQLLPYNTLSLKGNFSQAEMHNWLKTCIPEMPERLQLDSGVLAFKHVFVYTVLLVEFSKGIADFKSDNLSTVSILKEFLTKEATKKRIKLEINQLVNEASIPHVIKIVEPQLINHVTLKEEYKLLDALLELDIQNEDEFNILSKEYQDILNDKERILEAYKKDPLMSNRIFGFLTDLYIDRFKFKGVGVKNKIPTLIKLLEDYQFDVVVEFFIGPKSNEASLETAFN